MVLASRSKTWKLEKKTWIPNEWLSGCRLLTQITLLFLLSGFVSVLFLIALLHSSLIAFFVFMRLDISSKCTQKLLLVVWVPRANGPGRANASCTCCWDGVWLVTLAASVYELCENSACFL